MNAALYGLGRSKRQWILVDCGMGFGGEEHLPGIDVVYPDLRFIEEDRENLSASSSPTRTRTISAPSSSCGRP